MTATTATNIMLKDAKGRMVPQHLIKPVDQLRNQTVDELLQGALALQGQLKTFKLHTLRTIETFCSLSAAEYGVTVGGTKGNVTLMSFDGCRKVTRQIQDRITFDERLQAAKALIDECLTDWTEHADDKIRLIVQDAFQVDREGKISTERVLSLRRIKIDDPKWVRAMRALTDSIRVDSSKSYVRFYQRASADEAWQPVALDLAAVEVE